MRRSLVAAIAAIAIAACATPHAAAQLHTTEQATSDEAQRKTLAFSALGMVTGNLASQSFFPPGKVADYTGFQYLRDNDPDNMGHNTSFLSRAANNVLYILTDAQLATLKALAVTQVAQTRQYGLMRYPLMQAFRRLVDGTGPTGSSGLSLAAVRSASRDLYLLDGQISYDRANLYADIYRSMTAAQIAYLDAMKGKGWGSWPDIPDDQVRPRMRGLPPEQAVAVMTYAGDIFSWYAGSLAADVYFCPERHGTYFGSFYMKDAPAVGHEGYSISQSLTAEAGSAVCDTRYGYVTAAQAALFTQLVEVQRSNLVSGAYNIVGVRTAISNALRSLISPTPPSAATRASVLELVLAQSALYGELDGENEVAYAATMAQLRQSLDAPQALKLAQLRQEILSGTYADGTPFDFTICTTPYLYAAIITDLTVLAPYIADTDYLFAASGAQLAVAAASGRIGQAITLSATLTRSADGATVAGETVAFTVDGVSVGSGLTDASGVASVSTIVPEGAGPGTRTITAQHAVTADYEACSGSGVLTVSKGAPSFSLYAVSGAAGQSVTLKALVYCGASAATGLTVQFAVDGTVVGDAVTGASGASRTYTIPASATVGTHNVTVAFAGSTCYTSASRTAAALTVTPPKVSVGLSPYAVTGAAGQSVTLSTLVYVGGAPATGLTVVFAVDGSTVGSAVSDASGASRSWTIPASMATGTHSLTVTFAGDATHNAAARTVSCITVTLPKAGVSFSQYAAAGSAGQNVTLRTLVYSGGSAASGLTIQFAVDGVAAGSATSDAAGASLAYTIPAGLAAGTHSVTVTFAGDATHNAAARTTACLTVK